MKGKTIAITKSDSRIDIFANKLQKHNAKLIPLKPTTVIQEDPTIILHIIKELQRKKYDYCFFLSPVSVQVLFDMALQLKKKSQILSILNDQSVKIVSIGDSTKRVLSENNIKVDIIPKEFSSKGIIKYFSQNTNIASPKQKIIIPRSKRADGYLRTELKKFGYLVDEYFIYTVQTSAIDHIWGGFSILLQSNKIDSLVFTSPSNVTSFLEIIDKIDPELKSSLYDIDIIVSIGPSTSRALQRNNIRFTESSIHSLDGIYKTILEYFK
ncbi:MAG: uroporphyrinogen-III synthase [Nitrososphaeraceae archaeon]